MVTRLLVLLFFFLILGCEPYPKDPQNTLIKIQQSGTLRVGLISNPPWVETDPPSGREVELVKQFSRTLKVSPEWQVYAIEDGFHALKKRQIDLLIGGLLHSSPYKKKGGFTRPYVTVYNQEAKAEKHVMAVPDGENRFLIALESFLNSHTEEWTVHKP